MSKVCTRGQTGPELVSVVLLCCAALSHLNHLNKATRFKDLTKSKYYFRLKLFSHMRLKITTGHSWLTHIVVHHLQSVSFDCSNVYIDVFWNDKEDCFKSFEMTGFSLNNLRINTVVWRGLVLALLGPNLKGQKKSRCLVNHSLLGPIPSVLSLLKPGNVSKDNIKGTAQCFVNEL